MASITIQIPDQEALEFDLDSIEQLTIGRGPDNDIVLEHVSMSGSHAVIQNLGGSFQLTDLGSTNGTFVNGAQIEEVVLESGVPIQFGSVEAVFSDGEIADDDGDEAFVGGESSDDEVDESSDGESDQAIVGVEVADVSNRPSNFNDLSPIEKVEKKNLLAQISLLVGAVAILAAVGLIVISTTMEAS